METNETDIEKEWNSWMESHILSTGYFTDAAICVIEGQNHIDNLRGANKTSLTYKILIETETFRLNKDQANKIANLFIEPTPAFKSGIIIGKLEFIPIMMTHNLIYARRDLPGHGSKFCLFCTRSANFVIVTLSSLPNKAPKIYGYLTNLNKFLIENGM